MRRPGLRLAALLVATVCTPLSAATELSLRIVDASGEPLQHAVVTVSGEAPAADGEGLVRIAQEGQQFAPRVTVVRRGTTIRFPNRDITQHHVYSFSEPKPFELELYAGDDADPVYFDRAGIVALGCNIHDWMLGYIYVTDDPWFAVTGESGLAAFEIEPAADSQLTVWHPAGGEPAVLRISDLSPMQDGAYAVTIETAATDPLDFEIDPLQHLFSESGK